MGSLGPERPTPQLACRCAPLVDRLGSPCLGVPQGTVGSQRGPLQWRGCSEDTAQERGLAAGKALVQGGRGNPWFPLRCRHTGQACLAREPHRQHRM